MIVIPVRAPTFRVSAWSASAALAFTLAGCGSESAPEAGTPSGGASVATGGTASGGSPAGAATGGTLTGGSSTGGATGGSTGGTPSGGTGQGGTSGGTPASGGAGMAGGDSGGIAGAAGNAGAGGASLGGAGSGGDGGLGGAAGGGAAGGGAGGAAGQAGGGSGGGGTSACDTSPGKAMQFAEGVTDQMTGNIGSDGPSGDGPRTLELWAKFTSANSWTAEQTIIELGRRRNTGNQVWGIDMSGRSGNGGRFGPYTNGVTDNNGSSGPYYEAAPDVGWLHLSWAYEGSGGEMVFTVNGEQLPIQDPGNNYTLDLTPGIVTLGASQSFGATGWDGVMDEVRIWTVYRSPQEITDSMNVFLKGDEPGLAAYYNFDDSDGSFVDDVNGTPSHRLEPCTAGNDDRCTATNNAMPSIVTSDLPGPFTCVP